MRIAIPEWQGRVSPVLDVAGRVQVFEVVEGRASRPELHSLTGTDPFSRAAELVRLGADTVICGALSRPLEAALVWAGVRVFSLVCGPIEQVLQAFLEGALGQEPFAMPGARLSPKRWGAFGRCRMPRGFGMGGGQGRCAGGPGGRHGRMGGPSAAGVGGHCVCPACGEKTPHVAGQPCKEVKCPKCGAAMRRG